MSFDNNNYVKDEPSSPLLAPMPCWLLDIKDEPLSPVLSPVPCLNDVPPYYADREWILSLTQNQLPERPRNVLPVVFVDRFIGVKGKVAAKSKRLSKIIGRIRCGCIREGRFSHLCFPCPICFK